LRITDLLVHPEVEPALGGGEVDGAETLVKLNGRLVPVQDLKVATRAALFEARLKWKLDSSCLGKSFSPINIRVFL
jgi:hypothetical protein